MAFTVNDFEDLVGLLAQHPEWRERLRPLVVGDELLGVPGRLDRIEANLEAVTVQLLSVTSRLDHLTDRAPLDGDVLPLQLGEEGVEVPGQVHGGHGASPAYGPPAPGSSR